MSSRRRLILFALALVALCVSGPAAAGLVDEQALAERYAPVVRLVAQAKECGPGEPYRPIDVDVLFGADTVSLRGPWNRTDLITIGPTATQVGKGLYGYHLDFPGDALNPGCGYEQWARTISAGTKPTVYAHVAVDAGASGEARAAVLAVLRLQRLEQLPRRRLGNDPASLRRTDRGGGAAAASRGGRLQPARRCRASRVGKTTS